MLFQGNQHSMGKIYTELQQHGGWQNWYDELSPFRSAFEKYTKDMYMKPFYGKHVEDHHAFGYFAPIDLKRMGFRYRMRTPAEQLLGLSEQFEKRGITFIYIALPCKAAVYPEMYIDKQVLPKDEIVIPQWRKVLFEAMCLGVNVIDMFPVFLQNKAFGDMLFDFGHMITPYAAAIIGETVAEYVKPCVSSIPKLDGNSFKLVQTNTTDVYLNDIPYTSSLNTGEISLFGNCNSTGLRDRNCIAAHIAYNLKRYVNHVGRLLPFGPAGVFSETVRACLPSSFANKKIVFYVGFPSASFVRCIERNSTYNLLEIHPNAFKETPAKSGHKFNFENILSKGVEDESNQREVADCIKDSGFFDDEFYKNTYLSENNTDPIMHYVHEGAANGNSPAAWFSFDHYLQQLGINITIINPFLHYLAFGRKRCLSTRAHYPRFAINIMKL